MRAWLFFAVICGVGGALVGAGMSFVLEGTDMGTAALLGGGVGAALPTMGFLLDALGLFLGRLKAG